MCSSADQEWFRSWFNSPYYHMLYKHRDDKEAASFLDVLIKKLDLKKNSSILDLACGKGRHAIYLHEKGFKVTGLDLSEESINAAKMASLGGVEFITGDMRSFDLGKKFDCVMNLFTSFGYFNCKDENQQVVNRIYAHLETGGHFVLDYFNADAVNCSNKYAGLHQCNDVNFTVNKRFESDHIIKEIEVNDQGKTTKFHERVQLIRLDEVKAMLKVSGFVFEKVYGNYNLDEYHSGSSERMIIIARK